MECQAVWLRQKVYRLFGDGAGLSCFPAFLLPAFLLGLALALCLALPRLVRLARPTRFSLARSPTAASPVLFPPGPVPVVGGPFQFHFHFHFHFQCQFHSQCQFQSSQVRCSSPPMWGFCVPLVCQAVLPLPLGPLGSMQPMQGRLSLASLAALARCPTGATRPQAERFHECAPLWLASTGSPSKDSTKDALSRTPAEDRGTEVHAVSRIGATVCTTTAGTSATIRQVSEENSTHHWSARISRSKLNHRFGHSKRN